MNIDNKGEVRVSIIVGSTSDLDVMKRCEAYLDYFGISNELKVISAHRNPSALSEHIAGLRAQGTRIVVAAAGMAAHLPGVIASQTTLPVIGVPLAGSDLKGVDSLLSIVQMPSGIPVATVAIGKAGAANAAILCAEILAINDPSIGEKLTAFRAAGSKI